MDSVESVSSNKTHSMILKKDGSVWGTGNNVYGNIGTGSRGETLFAPTRVFTP